MNSDFSEWTQYSINQLKYVPILGQGIMNSTWNVNGVTPFS